ncbi:hypothetical protein F5884DRAFT_801511 [Xylogone sp. PMI_703]|nr:hypothetical protein F5884DRAFT_801511 [Xylogone sp. PMI_703]
MEPAFFWDFGTRSPVTELGKYAMIWSNCDRIEAFINGAHYATLTAAIGDFPHTKYPPFYLDTTPFAHGFNLSSAPTLRLDGYVGNKTALSRSFSGSTEGDRLEINSQDNELLADGVDASLLTFRVVDLYGAPRPYTEGNVQITVTGPGTWVGQLVTVDVDVEPADENSATITATLTNGAFPLGHNGGVGGVLIRTLDGQSGVITVKVSHPTIGDAEVNITSKENPNSSPAPGPRGNVPTGPPTLNDMRLHLTLNQQTPGGSAGQGSVNTIGTSISTFSSVPPGESVKATWKVAGASNSSTLNLLVNAGFSMYNQPCQTQKNITLQL